MSGGPNDGRSLPVRDLTRRWLAAQIAESGVEPTLLASIHRHLLDRSARASVGDNLLAAARDDQRERAALAWVDAVSSQPIDRIPDDVFDFVCGHFSPTDVVALTMAALALNEYLALASDAEDARLGVMDCDAARLTRREPFREE